MTPIVSVDGVTKRFGTFTAVDDMDLTVQPGEIVGLLGANGAGKTTLIKMLLGLLEPTEGSVRLFGERHSRRQRRRIGYVPQNLGLYPDLTEAENLQFRADAFGVEVPSSIGEDRLLGDAPLGRQRIVAFAAATQHQPELLVLDEPTSGVSSLARSRLWDLIHDRADAGVGVLVSTHYMDEAEQADRLVVMARGRLVAEGTTDDVIGAHRAVSVASPQWADVFRLLDAAGHRVRLAGRRVRVLGVTSDAVREVILPAGLDATVESVPATLEERLIELDSVASA